MSKILTCLALSALIITPAAQACQLYTAKIEATVSGSSVESGTSISSGVCIVNVVIDKIKKGPACNLTGLEVGQEIEVRVPQKKMLPDGCPEDEGYTLRGEIISSGDKYTLIKGTVE
jgi:hypothetical protein